MKKFLTALALFILPVIAHAQTFPTPSYNDITIPSGLPGTTSLKTAITNNATAAAAANTNANTRLLTTSAGPLATQAGANSAAAIAAGGGVVAAGGNASATVVTATGAAQPRTLATMAADTFNVLNYIESGDSDDTAGVNRAIAALTATTNGGTLYFPATRDYHLSANLTITVSADQHLVIRSDGLQGARLHFTNSASAGITVTLAANSGAQGNGPSITIENLAGVSDWSTTESQSLISVIRGVAGGSYSQTPAALIENVSSATGTNSGGFLHAVFLQDVNHSKLKNIYMNAASSDTTANALDITGTVTQSTGILVDTLRQQNGGTAVVIGDYIQGVNITSLQTVNTQHSVNWTTDGSYTTADNLNITNAQMNSALGEITTVGVRTVEVSSSYLLANTVGWVGISITGSLDHVITGNVFDTTISGGDPTAIGVELTNASSWDVTGNTFTAFTGTTSAGAPIVLAGTTKTGQAVGNTVVGNTVGVDASTAAPDGNEAANNTVNTLLVQSGFGSAGYVLVAGRTVGTAINTISAGTSNSILVGSNNTTVGTVTGSALFGSLNTSGAPGTLENGFHNSSNGSYSAALGSYASTPYANCFAQGGGISGTSHPGGAEQIFCSWQAKTTSTTPVRLTNSGSTTYSPANTLGLSSLVAGGAAQLVANFEITISMVDETNSANSGTWTLPIGQLVYDTTKAPTTTWTAGTPVTLGAAFTVSITADTTNTGLNLTLTSPSADTISYTVGFRETVVYGY
jgi:hypothetical protein